MATDYKIWTTLRISQPQRDLLERVYRAWATTGVEPRGEALVYDLFQNGMPRSISRSLLAAAVDDGLLDNSGSDAWRPRLAAAIAIAELAEPRRDLECLESIVEYLHRTYEPGSQPIRIDDIAAALELPRGTVRRVFSLGGSVLPQVSGTGVNEAIVPSERVLDWTSFDEFLRQAIRHQTSTSFGARDPELTEARELNARLRVDHIAVRDLLSYHDATLRLGGLTVLVGRNGAGKTNALKILNWLRSLATTGLWSSGIVQLTRRQSSKQPVARLDFELSRPAMNPTHGEYLVEIGTAPRPFAKLETLVVGEHETHLRETVHVEKGSGFTSTTGTEQRSVMIPASELVLTNNPDVRRNWELGGLRGGLSRWRVIFADDTERETTAFDPLRGEPGSALELLDDVELARVSQHARQIFPDIMEVRKSDANVVVVERSDNAYRIDDISGGVRRSLYILAIALSSNPPPLIAIDEFENGLHAGVIGRLVESLRSATDKTQVVLTTHSTRVAEVVAPEEVIVVERTGRGSTFTPLVDQPKLRRMLKHQSLAEILLGGVLGEIE